VSKVGLLSQKEILVSKVASMGQIRMAMWLKVSIVALKQGGHGHVNTACVNSKKTQQLVCLRLGFLSGQEIFQESSPKD